MRAPGRVDIPQPTPAQSLGSQIKTIDFQGQKYGYEVIKVSTPAALTLIPNFQEKLITEELIAKNTCASAVSGGFYTEDAKPLGLFILGKNTLSKVKKSTLFNGFFWMGSNNHVGIDYDLPVGTDFRFALQSGPIVLYQGKPIILKLSSDKPARRILVGVDKQKTMFFIIVYNPDVTVLGPNLTDLPGIVGEISTTQDLELDSAINLDGGRASAFYTSELTLAESNPVGSLFCLTGP